MSATCSLSQEQKTVLGSAYSTLWSVTIYLRVLLPVIRETDEQILAGLVEMAEMHLKRLPQCFPELQPLADEREKRGGL